MGRRTGKCDTGGGPDDRRCRPFFRLRNRHRRGGLFGCPPQPVGVTFGGRSGQTGRQHPARAAYCPAAGRPTARPITAFGPGVDVTFPNDPYLVPFMAMELAGTPGDGKTPTHVTSELVKNARLIATPEERSLALQRIANGAMASNQLYLAHQALEEAITATSKVTEPLVRDQRLIAIVTSLNLLTDATLRVGLESIKRPMTIEPVDKDKDVEAPAPKRCPATKTRRCSFGWRAWNGNEACTCLRSSPTRPIETKCSIGSPKARHPAARASPTNTPRRPSSSRWATGPRRKKSPQSPAKRHRRR